MQVEVQRKLREDEQKASEAGSCARPPGWLPMKICSARKRTAAGLGSAAALELAPERTLRVGLHFPRSVGLAVPTDKEQVPGLVPTQQWIEEHTAMEGTPCRQSFFDTVIRTSGTTEPKRQVL